MKRKSKGFTLVELLAVIVILAIILIIAIPAVMSATQAAKKESFFLYAQSLQSKAIVQYTQDLEHKQENTNCAIYDIDKDLGLSDTGKYEGWVKVSRKAEKSGEKQVTLRLPSSGAAEHNFEYVKYCVGKSNCNPTETYPFSADTFKKEKSVTIIKNLSKDQVLCAKYQYANADKHIVSSDVQCISYDKGSDAKADSYTYEVTMTIRDNSYVVKDVLFNKDMSMEAFYAEMDKQDKTAEGNVLAIAKPTCTQTSGSDVKDTTTTTENPIKLLKSLVVEGYDIKFKEYTESYTINVPNEVTTIKLSAEQQVKKSGDDEIALLIDEEEVSPNALKTIELKPGTNPIIIEIAKVLERDAETNKITKKSYINSYLVTVKRAVKDLDKTTTTTKTTQSIQVGTTTKTTQSVQVSTTTKTTGSTQVTTTTTTRETSQIPTTTIDVQDTSLLLNTLNVSGYDIGFSPLKFYYHLTVPYEVTKLNISATGTTDVTIVSVNGGDNLLVGSNPVVVDLYNQETGKTSHYTITVKRVDKSGSNISTTTKKPYGDWDPDSGMPDPTLDESNAMLTYLSVSGYRLDFRKDVYEYTLETLGEDNLVLSYRTESKGAMVNVNGDKGLQDGSQIVVIVQSPNGYYTKTYTITVKFKETTASSTKFLRGVAVGLGVVLVAALTASKLIKNKKAKVVEDKDDISNNNQGSI